MSNFEKVDDDKFFLIPGEALNALYKIARQWENLEVKGGTLTKSDRNAILKIEEAEKSEAADINIRAIPASLSYSSVLPTVAEVRTAIEDAYDNAGVTPSVGDIVYMAEFHYQVMKAINVNDFFIGANGLFRVQFSVNDTLYMAFQIGPNRLF